LHAALDVTLNRVLGFSGSPETSASTTFWCDCTKPELAGQATFTARIAKSKAVTHRQLRAQKKLVLRRGHEPLMELHIQLIVAPLRARLVGKCLLVVDDDLQAGKIPLNATAGNDACGQPFECDTQ